MKCGCGDIRVKRYQNYELFEYGGKLGSQMGSN
jgi:hypothetical protein